MPQLLQVEREKAQLELVRPPQWALDKEGLPHSKMA